MLVTAKKSNSYITKGKEYSVIKLEFSKEYPSGRITFIDDNKKIEKLSIHFFCF